jgi:hypothetical protein
MRILANGFVLTAALVGSGAVYGDVTYEYVGNDFTYTGESGSAPPPPAYTTSDFVSVSMTLSAALGPNLVWDSIYPSQFSFSDGQQTITNVSATNTDFEVWTNGSGQITNWIIVANNFNLASHEDQIGTYNSSQTSSPGDQGTQVLCGQGSSTTAGCYLGGAGFGETTGSNTGDPGIWSISAVPEPTSVCLMLSGLGGLGAFMRKRRTPKFISLLS